MVSDPSTTSSRPRMGKFDGLVHVATGGMGAVYRAWDLERHRQVALKVLSPDLAARPGVVERFRREAAHVARLRHRNIAQVYEWGEVNGLYYLALEFVDGPNLEDYVKERGRLDVEESRQLLLQAVKALSHVHAQGFVHRDVKPSNFLVTYPKGRPLLKLIDLGLAREVNDPEHSPAEGPTLGTIDYISPEQARDSRSADIRSDIYSLGCSWYHMLAGHPPFPDGSLADRVAAHTEKEAPDVRTLNPDVPAPVAAVLAQMLAKDPARRYQTPVELLRALLRLERQGLNLYHEMLKGLADDDDERAERLGPSGTGQAGWWLWALGTPAVIAALVLIWTVVRPQAAPAPEKAPTASPAVPAPDDGVGPRPGSGGD